MVLPLQTSVINASHFRPCSLELDKRTRSSCVWSRRQKRYNEMRTGHKTLVSVCLCTVWLISPPWYACVVQMQQQELAQMRQREANLTALAAIGPRKKRKIVDSPSSSATAEVTELCSFLFFQLYCNTMWYSSFLCIELLSKWLSYREQQLPLLLNGDSNRELLMTDTEAGNVIALYKNPWKSVADKYLVCYFILKIEVTATITQEHSLLSLSVKNIVYRNKLMLQWTVSPLFSRVTVSARQSWFGDELWLTSHATMLSVIWALR